MGIKEGSQSDPTMALNVPTTEVCVASLLWSGGGPSRVSHQFLTDGVWNMCRGVRPLLAGTGPDLVTGQPQ